MNRYSYKNFQQKPSIPNILYNFVINQISLPKRFGFLYDSYASDSKRIQRLYSRLLSIMVFALSITEVSRLAR